MKINEVTEARFETDPEQKKRSEIGRALMDYATKIPMKGKTDAQVGLVDKMSQLGSALTRFGTDHGPKNIEDVKADTGLSVELIQKFMALGEKLAAKGVKLGVPDPEDNPQDDSDEFAEPSDDEIARQADARAAKRK
jgi:hypothetical protein